ncbi:TPA: hypothetical protein N0F65_004998 [Lagenidium giganteum]|uniref:Uncharacterized protein n=1 Tax=Lagenidium giganteum TaxID=4803 RepID=A0AAV2ZLH0_9STRA|nr:TPA: hypothetical protein N0F65_004998 [Lagenidium giganteum]
MSPSASCLCRTRTASTVDRSRAWQTVAMTLTSSRLMTKPRWPIALS